MRERSRQLRRGRAASRGRAARHSGRRSHAGLAALASAALAACLVLAGCFGIPAEPQVAATVNGDKIYESEVTDYIEGFRSKNQEYETDSGWAEFLISNSYTAETIRQHVLDTNFIPKLLIRQECARRDITLTDEQLDSVIEREKEYYEQRYGENSWNSVLASYGYDEESWRENESDRLLEEQLERKVVKSAKATNAEVQQQANENAVNYNGKHSWYLEFASEDEANDARAKVKFDPKGKTTVKRFRKAGDGAKSAGWSSLAHDRESMSMEYVNALNAIGAGEVSQPVQQDDKWLLIFCDRVFRVDKDEEYVSLSSVPKAIRAQLREDASKAKTDQRFRDWLEKETDGAQIEIADMPSGLPYDVNVAIDDGSGNG